MSQNEAMENLDELIQQINESDTPNEGQITSLKEFRAIDIADVYPRLKSHLKSVVFEYFSDELAADVLVELDDIIAIEILGDLDPERIANILNFLPPDEGADMIALSEEDEQPEILAHVEKGLATQIRDLATYEPESAGGLMTSNYIYAGENETTLAVLVKVKTSEQVETISQIYILDEDERLTGVVSVRELLQAELNIPVSQIMEKDVISVPLHMDQEEVSRTASKYHLNVLPVVDEHSNLKGIITFDDLMDVFEEESSEDMYRMAGEVDEHPTYQPVIRRIQARLPWLMVTLVGTFLAALMIKFFESWISKDMSLDQISFFSAFTIDKTWTFLLCFLPMIGGMAGNVGIQSSTVMVRGFATGEIEPSFFLSILWKEILIAAAIGLVSGLIVGGLIYWAFPGTSTHGFVVGLSLFTAILSAAIIGTLTPFICLLFKVDPAYASGPLLTTLNDIFGFLIFFGIASRFLDFGS